jgi:hypothetical protein
MKKYFLLAIIIFTAFHVTSQKVVKINFDFISDNGKISIKGETYISNEKIFNKKIYFNNPFKYSYFTINFKNKIIKSEFIFSSDENPFITISTFEEEEQQNQIFEKVYISTEEYFQKYYENIFLGKKEKVIDAIDIYPPLIRNITATGETKEILGFLCKLFFVEANEGLYELWVLDKINELSFSEANIFSYFYPIKGVILEQYKDGFCQQKVTKITTKNVKIPDE